jgi:hypothetical protein
MGPLFIYGKFENHGHSQYFPAYILKNYEINLCIYGKFENHGHSQYFPAYILKNYEINLCIYGKFENHGHSQYFNESCNEICNESCNELLRSNFDFYLIHFQSGPKSVKEQTQNGYIECVP